MVKTLVIALAIFVLFAVPLGALGRGVAEPELLVWIVMLLVTEVAVLRWRRHPWAAQPPAQ